MAVDSSSLPDVPDIKQLLSDAMASATESEANLRSFAAQGDDEDVQTTFALLAEQTALRIPLLRERFAVLFGDSEAPSGAAPLHFALPHLGRMTATGTVTIPEERILQNLLAAYTAETGEMAISEALAAGALAAGDPETEALARKLEDEEREAADKIWHFLSTRSKIAFNMLTVSEVDPSVETKVADDRVTS